MDQEDSRLLRDYVRHGSHSAFGHLVERHLPMVYATALRETGEPAAAEDVCQAAFLILVQKARGLKQPDGLAGWLFRVTRYAAANARRLEQRRQKHERRASQLRPEMQNDQDESFEQIEKTWAEIEPRLNAALAKLKSKDREAILLRYFEDRSLKQVAEALGCTEPATKMRLGRALEKLRGILGGERMASVAALTAVLEAKAIVAVPAGLAGSVTAAVLSGVTAATGQAFLIAKGAMRMMAWTKAKLVATVGIGAIVLGVSGIQITRIAVAQGQTRQTQIAATAPLSPTTGATTIQTAKADDGPGDAQGIVEAARSAQRRFPTQYRAIFWMDEDGGMVDVVYRQGDKVRMSHFFSLLPSRALPDVKEFHLDLPATAEEVLQWSQKQTAVDTYLVSDRDYYRRDVVPGFVNEPSRPKVRVSRAERYAQNLLPLDNKIEDIHWPFANHGGVAELLPQSSETAPGCIGLRFGGESRRFDYYVDPKKDYICTKETWWEKRGEIWQKAREYRFEDLHQIDQTATWCIGKAAVVDFGDETKNISRHAWVRRVDLKVLKADEYPQGVFDGNELLKGADLQRN